MLNRSPEQIATVLGVLKAGGAVVPLDPSYPQARIDAMINQVRPFRVISDTAEAQALMQVTATTTLPAIDPDDAAYVLFTSGSTGEPKGVTMPHRALANLITWQNRRRSGAAGGSTLQFFPLSFDVSFQEIFSTLCGGGTLRLLSESPRKNLRRLVEPCRRGGDRTRLSALRRVAGLRGGSACRPHSAGVAARRDQCRRTAHGDT